MDEFFLARRKEFLLEQEWRGSEECCIYFPIGGPISVEHLLSSRLGSTHQITGKSNLRKGTQAAWGVT